MANATAARTDVQDLNTIDSFQVLGTAAPASWFRGTAIAYVNDAVGGAAVGTPSKTFDGTVPLAFMGVVKRDITTTATSTGYQLNIPLKRDGAVGFNLVDVTGLNPTVAASTDLGRPCFFRSDNEVSLAPPNGNFPCYAGRIVGITGMTGCTGLATTQVLVDISDACRGFGPQWTCIPFGPTALAALDGSNTLDIIKALTTTRRYWARRIIVREDAAFDTADLTVKVLNGAVPLSAAGITIDKDNSAMGRVTIGNLDVPASQMFDFNDVLSITVTSSGNVTAGSISGYLEILPLQ